ncbi:hypothetical protein GPECTOR_55g289 [Gonium pectorale]|uniref:Uncharacterized protein n=1 Tax=Gonium pectorale TaxID=33097 RepID=A0A150G6I7_GONPE|nr:hypothetical protein GPECTOR_55g289 [Gonium pectorale]|eukprot:KXZ45383.1 hypothetical protein GPECTOR_55g289 [Gonium pectorale]
MATMQAATKERGTIPVACASSRVFPKLQPELTAKIVSCLDPNDVPFFRLVNKAAAAQFSGPQHTTIRLSEPVAPHAFAAHWLAPGAARGLTQNRRWQLLCLTAASGVVANLEMAVRAAGCLPTYKVFVAAASTGKLEPCQWLWDHGCPTKDLYCESSGLLAAAAGGGHRHVCEWLLTLDLAWSSGGAAEAARGGHVGLMEWLQQVRPQLNVHTTSPAWEKRKLVEGAADGCDLATLQQQWGDGDLLDERAKEEALVAAAGSPTPDWAAKVEWLEAQGCLKDLGAAAAAAVCSDAASRLAWLQGRGYPLGTGTVCTAAEVGNLAAVQYLLEEAGVEEDGSYPETATFIAAREGHLEVLQALHSADWCFDAEDMVLEAAENGHLHVLAWLVELEGEEWLGSGSDLLTAAARSGNMELLTWLVERGCDGWSDDATTSAAASGCEEALEWLVARGCPMKDDGSPYTMPCRDGDLAMARLLRRMGAPWGPAGSVVMETALVAPVPMLRWLLEEGCPVGDYEAALAKAGQRASGREEALALLEAHRMAQQEGGKAAAADDDG